MIFCLQMPERESVSLINSTFSLTAFRYTEREMSHLKRIIHAFARKDNVEKVLFRHFDIGKLGDIDRFLLQMRLCV